MWNYKNILRLFPIAIVIVIIVFFESTSKNEREIFTESSLNNMIIEIKSNWSGGRSCDYITDNRIVITLRPSDSLLVGDSIVKKANSLQFVVYRFDSLTTRHMYYKEYDLVNY
jgi:hypothetical protein|tara:strand:+ start:705 stop:1043 length:339 start_codon:yes stop_codon:yes gene_type:complete